MANPTYKTGAIPRRKQPGAALIPEDSSDLTEPIGVYNATPPTLSDGDVRQFQLDDYGNLKVALGDPLQIYALAPQAETADNNSVTIGSTSTSVMAANASRIEMILTNDSDEVIYISFSGTAVMNKGIRLNANGGIITNTSYKGAVTAICSSGSKNLAIIEI